MVDFDSDTLSKILISEEVYAMLLNHFDLRGMKDSRDVAEKLQMEHKNLLRIIEQILKTNEPSYLSGEEGSSAHSTNELSYLSGEQILKTNEPSYLSGEEGSSAHSTNGLPGEEGSSTNELSYLSGEEGSLF